MILVFR